MRQNFLPGLAALIVAIVTLFAASPGSAGNQLSVAIAGYDAVSYHQGEPAEGQARFNHFWNGAVWYFASEENRNSFRENPTEFAPAFDGYCAWAASQGYKAPGDPSVYRVVDGTLYLQVHPRAQELWEADVPKHIAAGEENWPRIHPF
ncbi:MAG: YHS domain-containing (seleno)protein [Pseudomonadota bacterium]